MWKSVDCGAQMTNDSQFNPYIDSADRPALQHLTDFELKHDASDPRIVSFTFVSASEDHRQRCESLTLDLAGPQHFGADNPYFSDRTLTKSFTLAPDLDPSTALYDVDAPVISTPVAINWTSPDHDLVKKKPRINLDEVEEYDENFDIDGSVGSFFNFFSEEKDTVGIHEALLELHAVAVEYASTASFSFVLLPDALCARRAYAGVAHDEEISEDEDEEDEEDDDPNAVVDLEEDSDEGKAKKRQRQR